MNFILNLVIYNPLESLILISFVAFLNKEKFKIKNMFECFLLGAVNLFLQYPGQFIDNSVITLTYDVLINNVFLAITLYFAYYYIFNNSPKIYKCFYACIFNYTSLGIAIYLVDTFSTFEVWFPTTQQLPSITNMISVDIIVKLLQFLMLFIFEKGVVYIEKFIKKTSN